ncbi:MAG: dTMP kinase [Patescibacteria group bacterium]
MIGKFIVFEGGEGSGKTTQIELLEQKLRDNGFVVFRTREPGGTNCPISEKIRGLLKDPANKKMVAETELFLFLASRAQHVQQVIRPQLAQGAIVLCDRFYGSTLAYQHFARGLFNLDEVIKLNDFATHGLEPDATVLLNIDPEIGLARIKDQLAACRLDSEKLDFHKRVQSGYLTLAKIKPNWLVVSADNTVQIIHETIWNKVSELLKP